MNEFYANVTRDDKGKKQVKLGKKWGDLDKKRANTKCLATGGGLWVLDIDTKNYKELPKKLIKLLPKATVETANGFHYYFKGDGIPQTQKLIDKVDVRNEGGLVFTEYWGEDNAISYESKGKAVKPSKELMTYLKGAQKAHVERDIKTIDLSYKDGKPWKQYKDGEQHTMLMATMIKMFNERKSDEEVWSRAKEYQEKFLGDTRHETRLMKGRFDWAKSQIGDTKIKGKTIEKPKLKKKKAKKSVKKPWKKALLSGGEFDANEAERVNEMEYLSFLPKHHHTVSYGASGTMKTSIISKELIKEAVKDEELEVFLFSFDASDLHNRAMWRYAKEKGVDDRFHVLHDVRKEHLFDFIIKADKKGYNLDNVVIVVDTYKKIAGNVNDKGNNMEVMHELKTLTKLGCTVVTIAHSNKDGLTNSGTAELEQDSDGMLRFDAYKDASGSTISITEGGRVRFTFSECSYRCGGAESYDEVMENLEPLAKFVDVATIADKAEKQEASEAKDSDYIDKVKDAMKEGHVTLLPIMETTGISRSVARRVMRRYEGVHWRAKGENDNGGTIYEGMRKL